MKAENLKEGERYFVASTYDMDSEFQQMPEPLTLESTKRYSVNREVWSTAPRHLENPKGMYVRMTTGPDTELAEYVLLRDIRGTWDEMAETMRTVIKEKHAKRDAQREQRERLLDRRQSLIKRAAAAGFTVTPTGWGLEMEPDALEYVLNKLEGKTPF